LTHGDDGREEGEAGAQIDGHVEPGDEVKQQGAHAGCEKRHADIQAGEEWDQDGSAKHDEEMLYAQEQETWSGLLEVSGSGVPLHQARISSNTRSQTRGRRKARSATQEVQLS